jgi:hypothetical protein
MYNVCQFYCLLMMWMPRLAHCKLVQQWS